MKETPQTPEQLQPYFELPQAIGLSEMVQRLQEQMTVSGGYKYSKYRVADIWAPPGMGTTRLTHEVLNNVPEEWQDATVVQVNFGGNKSTSPDIQVDNAQKRLLASLASALEIDLEQFSSQAVKKIIQSDLKKRVNDGKVVVVADSADIPDLPGHPYFFQILEDVEKSKNFFIMVTRHTPGERLMKGRYPVSETYDMSQGITMTEVDYRNREALKTRFHVNSESDQSVDEFLHAVLDVAHGHAGALTYLLNQAPSTLEEAKEYIQSDRAIKDAASYILQQHLPFAVALRNSEPYQAYVNRVTAKDESLGIVSPGFLAVLASAFPTPFLDPSFFEALRIAASQQPLESSALQYLLHEDNLDIPAFEMLEKTGFIYNLSYAMPMHNVEKKILETSLQTQPELYQTLKLAYAESLLDTMFNGYELPEYVIKKVVRCFTAIDYIPGLQALSMRLNRTSTLPPRGQDFLIDKILQLQTIPYKNDLYTGRLDDPVIQQYLATRKERGLNTLKKLFLKDQ